MGVRVEVSALTVVSVTGVTAVGARFRLDARMKGDDGEAKLLDEMIVHN